MRANEIVCIKLELGNQNYFIFKERQYGKEQHADQLSMHFDV